MNTTKSTRKATVEYPAETELIIRRDFDAPRELVFEALTKAEHVREWYGLNPGALKVCEIDFRVGGGWHYVLGAPGEDEVSFTGSYLEIEAPERVVSTESFDNMPGATYRTTLTLTEANGVTTVQSHLVYPSQQWRDGHVDSGMEYGMNICYDRLEELLGRLAS